MTILLTGITGLLGCHVAISFLKAGHRVVAIARSRPGVPAQSRVCRLLTAYPGFGSELEDLSSLHVVEGDVMGKDCGISPQDLELLSGQLDAVVNCAGCVSFSPDCTDEELKVNIAGVKNIAGLAGKLQCGRLVHVSTAYVDSGLKGKGFRTPYERSKLEGEKAALAAAENAGVNVTIVRPSIITGDQRHGFTPNFNGIYPFFRFFSLFRDELKKLDRASVERSKIFLAGAVNIVPADYTAEIIRAIIEQSAKDSVFNVINPVKWEISRLIEIVMPSMGARRDDLSAIIASTVSADVCPANLQAGLKLLMETYEPYFNVDLDLDTRPTEALLKAAGMPILKNSQQWIFALVQWGTSRNWEEIS